MLSNLQVREWKQSRIQGQNANVVLTMGDQVREKEQGQLDEIHVLYLMHQRPDS